MSTHCYIGVEAPNGMVTYSYCHSDGFPRSVGKLLLCMSSEQAARVADFGDMRCVSLVPPYSPKPLAGCADPSVIVDCVQDYEDDIGAGPVDYAYLLTAEGSWMVFSCFGDDSGVWRSLKGVLNQEAQARVQDTSEPGYTGSTGGNHPMKTNEITGYVVINEIGEYFVDTDANGNNFTTSVAPKPVPRGDCFRRLAAFLDSNPDVEHGHFIVDPVYREMTPTESTAHELGGLLDSLCKRHGLDLGMDRAKMDTILAKELEALKDGRIASLLGIGR